MEIRRSRLCSGTRCAEEAPWTSPQKESLRVPSLVQISYDRGAFPSFENKELTLWTFHGTTLQTAQVHDSDLAIAQTNHIVMAEKKENWTIVTRCGRDVTPFESLG